MSTASTPTVIGARIAAPSPQRILPGWPGLRGLLVRVRGLMPARRAASPGPMEPLGTLDHLSEQWQYDLGLRDSRPARSVPGGQRRP